MHREPKHLWALVYCSCCFVVVIWTGSQCLWGLPVCTAKPGRLLIWPWVLPRCRALGCRLQTQVTLPLLGCTIVGSRKKDSRKKDRFAQNLSGTQNEDGVCPGNLCCGLLWSEMYTWHWQRTDPKALQGTITWWHVTWPEGLVGFLGWDKQVLEQSGVLGKHSVVGETGCLSGLLPGLLTASFEM